MRETVMWRTVLAALLVAHGVVHAIGFVVPLRLATVQGFSYRTTVVTGLDLGDSGVRALGVLWLLVGLALVVAGVGLAADAPWWWLAALGGAAGSLVLTALWADVAVAGLVIDLALVGLIALSSTVRHLAG